MATSIDRVPSALSNKDLNVLFKTFRDENFIQYLEEFTSEINNFQNWNQFNCQLEKFDDKLDVDVTSLQSTPGIALQAERNDNECPDSIVYINIVVSDKIGKPSFSCEKRNSDTGFKWSIPHAIRKPRLEFEVGALFSDWLSRKNVLNSNSKLETESLLAKIKEDGIWIYDILVNPVCLELSTQNETLKHHLIRASIEHIKDKIKIDLKNIKVLGFDLYVGNSVVSKVKSLEPNVNNDENQIMDFTAAESKITNEEAADYNMEVSQSPTLDSKTFESNAKSLSIPGITKESRLGSRSFPTIVKPKYKLKHVNHVTLQDFSKVKDTEPSSLRPNLLCLEILLPGVLSSSEIDVKVTGKEFYLKTDKQIKYGLEITLPYEVEEEPHKAKYDISTCVLELKLIVSKRKKCDMDSISSVPKIASTFDSGVECEGGYRNNSEGDSLSRSSESSHEENENLNHGAKNDQPFSENVEVEEKLLTPVDSKPMSNSMQLDSESKLRTNNSSDLSVSCDNDDFECDNVKISAETKEDIIAFFKQPLFPCSQYTQSQNFLFININLKNINIKNFVIEVIDNKTFRYQYKRTGNGFAPLFYGGFISTAPHAFKSKGVTHHILEETLLIQVEKKKPALWRKIKVGLEQRKMKQVKLRGISHPKNGEIEDDSNDKSSSGDSKDGVKSGRGCVSEEDTETHHESEDEDEIGTQLASSSVKIPKLERRTSECFVTGSWPRGILKMRSRSLSDPLMETQSDSQLESYQNTFGSSLECDDEVMKEEEEEAEFEEDGEVGSPTKKSVRFNEFVFKQVFRIDSSILGQKVKNQKKANQKKRARERKLSEGSQSSETETMTEQSDMGTTEDEGDGARASNIIREKFSKKKRDKSNKKKKNKKLVLNLSSEITEMVFQLDDD